MTLDLVVDVYATSPFAPRQPPTLTLDVVVDVYVDVTLDGDGDVNVYATV